MDCAWWSVTQCRDRDQWQVVRPHMGYWVKMWSPQYSRHGASGVLPEHGHKNDPTDEMPLLGEWADRAGAVHTGEGSKIS